MKRIAFALTTAALLAAPLAAQAQTTQSSTVNLAGDVVEACVLGNPDVAEMNLGDLTGPDGRLTPALVSSAISASTFIPVAWCNAPSVISIDATPLALVNTPAYSGRLRPSDHLHRRPDRLGFGSVRPPRRGRLGQDCCGPCGPCG